MTTKEQGDEAPRWRGDERTLPNIPAEARWALIEAEQNSRLKKVLMVPVFAELATDRTPEDLIRFLEEHPDQYDLPDHVMDRLAAEAARKDRPADDPVVFTLLSLPDSVDSAFWTVIAVGPPQARALRPGGFTRGRPIAVKTGKLSKTPVMGIIDDSIGFLHHRFRKPDGLSRFQHLWLMHSDTLAGNPGPVSGPPVLFGVELTKGDIDTRLTSGRSEMALYRQVNSGIFGAASRHGTAFHAGHGSHVLDLACGATATEAMAEVPILGVQLSPNSIGETSGSLLDPDIVRGLDWIITRALQMPGRFPLIINLSLGALAGPQDGTSLVERWIRSEITRYHHFSGKAPIRIVVAYGNAWRARLVAEADLKPGESVTLDWCLLPDDATKSVLELRSAKGRGGQIDLDLSPPDGAAPLSRPLFRNAPLVDRYITPRGIAAEVSDAIEAGFDTALVTVAPTVRFDLRPLGPAGRWNVRLTNTGQKTEHLILKVQRDDTPGGYRRNGRQSWLDHPAASGFEPATRAYSLPAATGPVTRRGSDVSYAGLMHPSAYFVGAARPDPRAKNGRLPAHYASEGSLPNPAAATVSALGDQGEALRGLRAAGNLTGSTARLSGSSMAAPQIARRLLGLAMNGNLAAQPVPNTPHDPAEIALVLGTAPAPVADAQLGKGTVVA
jgi:hypothetical protein